MDLKQRIAGAKPAFDLTEPADQESLMQLTEAMLAAPAEELSVAMGSVDFPLEARRP